MSAEKFTWVLSHKGKIVALKLLILIVLTFSLFAVKGRVLASLDYYQARQIVQQWQQSGGPGSKGEYDVAESAMRSAIEDDTENPLYLDLLAQILEWAVVAGYGDPVANSREAKKYYLQSSKLRPTWSVTWASLAMLKWRQGQFDGELLTYVKRAASFGPSQPEVHVMVASLGLALYKANHPYYLALSDETKNRLYLGLSHPQSVERVKSVIEQHDATVVTCRWLAPKSRFIRAKIDCPLEKQG